MKIKFFNREICVCAHLTQTWYAQKACAEMRENMEIKITDANFEEVVMKSDKPVLVDFWAEWCGPCKMIAPVLDELAKDYDGKLAIVKINVDENSASPAKFGIRGIPTLLLFKNGTIMGTKVGAASKSQLAAFIDSHL